MSKKKRTYNVSMDRKSGKSTIYKGGSKGLFTTKLKSFPTLADANKALNKLLK